MPRDAGALAPRFAWLDRTLRLPPAGQVLEVGCGHGLALPLIARRLPHGRVLGIDRSATMTAAAVRRNAEAIATGRVAVRTTTLASLPRECGPFTHVVAMNVRAFAVAPFHDVARLQDLVRADGEAWLYYDGPGRPQAIAFRTQAAAALQAAGWTVQEGAGDGRHGVLLIARIVSATR